MVLANSDFRHCQIITFQHSMEVHNRILSFIIEIIFTVTTTETTESIVEEIPLGSSHSLKRLKKSHENNLLDISSPESDANDSIPIDQIIEMDFGGPTCASCHL